MFHSKTTLMLLLFMINLSACTTTKKMIWRKANLPALTGSSFYKQVAGEPPESREALAFSKILSGNIPRFLRSFVRVNTAITGANGKRIEAYYYVAPDYLSIGTNTDFARIRLTPMIAQRLADSFHCFLSTRKMANDICKAAIIKIEPQPMFAFRDSTATFYHHHLIIEGQRQGRKGLIAGIKKDVVISGKISRDEKPGRVAIYGWHKPDGKPIQPLYTGHVNWYVDYSHGIRLVYEMITVNGKKMNYRDVLKDARLRRLLCDQDFCDFYKY